MTSVSYVNVYQRASATRETLNHQIKLLDQLISHLCHWPPQCWHNPYMSKGIMVSVIETMHKPSNKNRDSKADLAMLLPKAQPSREQDQCSVPNETTWSLSGNLIILSKNTFWQEEIRHQTCIVSFCLMGFS